MRRLAFKVAILGFFAMAMVGWIAGVPAHVCGLRALVSAGAIYFLVMIAGRSVARVLSGIMLQGIKARAEEKDGSSEHEHE